MSKKLSRREFARKSVAAGAAAVAVPSALMDTAAKASGTTRSAASGAAAAVNLRRRISLPPERAYGGDGWSGRGDVRLDEAPQTARRHHDSGGVLHR